MVADGTGPRRLNEYPDPVSFYGAALNAYQYWNRNKDRFETATEYAEALPEGQWASVADVASEAGVDPTALVRLLLGNRPEGWHRLLADDGAPPREAHLTEPEREEWLAFLDDDSVPAPDGRADPQHRMAAADLRLLAVPDVEEDARSRRAWLVRASDVLAGDLINDLWLPEGVCSLPASRLRDLPPGAAVEQIAHAVREDYSGAGVQDRERLTAEYHAFLSRMGENDIVVTNNGSDIYLGVVTGRPFFVSSVGERANLQRAVEWRNADRPPTTTSCPTSSPSWWATPTRRSSS